MNPTNDKLTQQPAPEQPAPEQPPALQKKKRFHLVRLEERIAPKSANAHEQPFTHKCRPSW